MSAHIHAALMAQYAQDAAETDKPWERWEYDSVSGWLPCEAEFSFCSYIKYRRRQESAGAAKGPA